MLESFVQLLDDVVKLESELASMQSAGKVDRAVDQTLEEIITSVSSREQFWFQGEPTSRNFVVYHSWRNLRLLFSKMRTRFADGETVHDNPLVVDQAREVVPKVLSLLASLVSTEDEPSSQKSQQLMRHIRTLRSTANRVKMIAPEAELEEVDQKKLLEAFDRLLEPMASNEA